MAGKFGVLYDEVMGCRQVCARNRSDKNPFMFSRQEGSLIAVKVAFVSEEVPPSYRSRSRADIERYLVSELSAGVGVVSKGIYDIVGGPVDVLGGPVYWTMATKCIPLKDHEPDVRNVCAQYLKREIELMPRVETIVAFGKPAFRSIAELSTSDTGQVSERLQRRGWRCFVAEACPQGYRWDFRGRMILVLPMLHPADCHTPEELQERVGRMKEKYIALVRDTIRRM